MNICEYARWKTENIDLDLPVVFPEFQAPRISRNLAQEGDKNVSPMHWYPLPAPESGGSK